MEAATLPGEASTRRRRAFVILSGVFGALVATIGFGLISLFTPWFESGQDVIHRVHYLSWGALGGIIIAGGLLVQVRAPERRIAAMQQVAIGGAALIVGSALGTEIDPLLVVIPVVIVGILAWLHPARERLWKAGSGINPALATLALLAAIPFVAFALDQADIQRTCFSVDPHCEGGHYAGMAAVALAIPAVGLLAAFKTPGWRIPAWSAGAAAILYGLASAAYPDYASSAGRAWGVVAMAGGLIFIAVAEWEARREPA